MTAHWIRIFSTLFLLVAAGCSGSVTVEQNKAVVELQRNFETACKEGRCPCSSPLGLIVHGGTAKAYEESEMPCDSSCESKAVTLTCNNGAFDRDISNLAFSCAVKACRACNAGNNQVPHGFAVTMHSAGSVSCLQSCEDVKRVLICKDGLLQGSATGPTPDGRDAAYSFASCSPASCVCPFESGGAASLNSQITFYKNARGTCGSPCSDPTNVAVRTCRNTGTVAAPVPAFNGDADARSLSCTGPAAEQCNCILPDTANTVLAHGRSQTLFASAAPRNCQTCASMQRAVFCDSGVLYDKPASDTTRRALPRGELSGFRSLACDAAASPDCTVGGVCVADTTSKTMYSKRELACGESAEAVTGIFSCARATLSKDGGPYSAASDPNAANWQESRPIARCNGCMSPWGVGFPVGGTMVAYKVSALSSNSCGGGCKMLEFKCTSTSPSSTPKFTSGDATIDNDLISNPKNYVQSCTNACSQEGGGAPPRFCLLPWQNSYVSADSLVPMWKQRTAICGDSCQNHFRLGRCQLMSGTFDAGLPYMYSACTELPCRGLQVTSVAPAFLSVSGGEVQLTGTGFSSATAVTIGGVPCPTLDVTGGGTKLRCRVAAGAVGPKHIVVANGAERAMLPNGFSHYSGACTGGPGRRVFSFTNANQTFTVPAGCSAVTVRAWGAGGGGRANNQPINQFGGAGGYAAGVVPVTAGATLTVVVGRGGTSGYSSDGGGYSGVFVGTPSPTSALLIAGGGGGAGDPVGCNIGGSGAEGGGTNGASRGKCSGGGGTQTTGGAAGAGGGVGSPLLGGSADLSRSALYGGGGVGNMDWSGSGMRGGGGGGGGYFGGGSGAPAGGLGGAGGGGSGFLAPGVSSGTMMMGVGFKPSLVTDPDYIEGVAAGGGGSSSAKGGDGLIVISW